MAKTSKKDNQFQIDLGRKLRAARQEKRLTIAKLAERAGISDKCIASVENGKSAPNIRTVYALCVAMRVSLDKLLDLRLPEEETELSNRMRSLKGAELSFLADMASRLLDLRTGQYDRDGRNFTPKEGYVHERDDM
jgi:transcriptional regulator with XRE-family HTH domain